MERHRYTTDTSHDAERLQMEMFRRMSPTERIRKVCQLSTTLRRMAMAAIERRYPELDEREKQLRFIEISYGKALADAVRQHARKQTSA
jgi:hypothetical protein